MFRLSDAAERFLFRVRDTAQRIIRKYFLVEVQEESVLTHDGPLAPIAEEQKDTFQIHIEPSPRITPDESRATGLRPESRTSPNLKNVTRIGKSIFIKGELALNENLTVDGRIVGKIEVKNHQLVIGPSGIVHAEIQAKNVTVGGKVVGNISASGMVTIQSTGSLLGGISAARIAINEGAHFKGTVDIILAKAQSAKG